MPSGVEYRSTLCFLRDVWFVANVLLSLLGLATLVVELGVVNTQYLHDCVREGKYYVHVRN